MVIGQSRLLERHRGTFPLAEHLASVLSTDAVADAVARRFLLAYKLRNFTSDTIEPQDAGVKAHHEEIRLWLLQAIFFLYSWTKTTEQV